MLSRIAALKIAVVCCCFLALAACSKKNTPDLEANNGFGAAAPGTEQEFKTVVGDRVFFAEDQSTLAPEAQETLRKQAAWRRSVSCASGVSVDWSTMK